MRGNRVSELREALKSPRGYLLVLRDLVYCQWSLVSAWRRDLMDPGQWHCGDRTRRPGVTRAVSSRGLGVPKRISAPCDHLTGGYLLVFRDFYARYLQLDSVTFTAVLLSSSVSTCLDNFSFSFTFV